MAFDLAISPFGDLIVSGAKDLQGAAGISLLDQQISLRLKLIRGSWFYDEEKTLGSNVYRATGRSLEQYQQSIIAYARQALEPMSDRIAVQNIEVESADSNGVNLIVRYNPKYDEGATDAALSDTRTVIVGAATSQTFGSDIGD